MTDPTDPCPGCQHEPHASGTECETPVNHGPSRFHLCLCLNQPGADRACPPLLDCQGGALGYSDVWHLQRGQSLQGASGEIVTPDVLSHEPAVVAPPTGHTTAAEAALAAVETALGDTLTADAREEALAGIAAVLPAPADHTAVRQEIRRALAAVDGFNVRWLDEQDYVPQVDAVLAVLYREWPWLRAEAEDAAPATDQTAELASLAVTAGRALQDEKRHYEIACQENARLRAKVYEWQGSYLEEVKVRQEREAEITRLHADRAAVLRWAADRIDATRADFPIAVQNGITWATAEMRRLAADEQPGARHVHITIHHPDPTTATTAARAIADLVRGEYGDSLRLTITTDAGARQDGRPATAYGDGKGRVYCIRCAPAVGADVPLTGTDVAPYELCPSCGRHAVDVAAAGARQDGTQQ